MRETRRDSDKATRMVGYALLVVTVILFGAIFWGAM